MSGDSTPAPVVYKPIPEYPGYRAGSDGSIWSAWKKSGMIGYRLTETWRQLKPGKTTNGYLFVSLTRNGKKKYWRVHVLVLLAHVGPCPPGQEACHDPDRDKTNCRLSNLRWDTRKKNHADKKKHGTNNAGERHGAHKLTWELVREIRRRASLGESQTKISESLPVCRETVGYVIRGETWKE